MVESLQKWIPAFAGMTVVDILKTLKFRHTSGGWYPVRVQVAVSELTVKSFGNKV